MASVDDLTSKPGAVADGSSVPSRDHAWRNELLEWAKLIVPVLISWPAFALLFLFFFKEPLIGVVDRFSNSEGSKAEFGPVKVEIGRLVLPPQYRDQAPIVAEIIKVDFGEKISQIEDQGPEGTTVGYSMSYAIEILLKEQGIDAEISARGIYQLAKEYDEWPGADYEGSSVEGAIKALITEGYFVVADWPNDQKTRPADLKAAGKIAGYSKLEDIAQVSSQLKDHRPVVAAIHVTRDFDSPEQGVIKISASPEQLGGHTICIVGYDEEKKLFRFANSWGASWGASGYGLIAENDLKTILQAAYVITVDPS